MNPSLPRLNRQLFLDPAFTPPPALSVDRALLQKRLPERVLQFGEGVFLRGFIDWMIEKLNRAKLFDGSVVVANPRAGGAAKAAKLNEQDGLFTLLLRGLENGKPVERMEIVSSISRAIDPYSDYEAFLALARSPDLRFVVSNTTEAGIVFDPSDTAEGEPPSTFPGKVTALLLERYNTFNGDDDRGLIFLPCELIEDNGSKLRECVLKLAEVWQLDAGFIAWVSTANIFANTLVDRIVSGFPKDEAPALEQKLGYRDELLNAGEVYHALVVQAPATVARELPLERVGLNVTWTEDVTPYRQQKVRILNGGHTSSVLAAYLAGHNTVGELMNDPALLRFLRHTLAEEVLPTLKLPPQQLQAFADAVCDRFANPFVKHALLSIAMNSTSKFKARVVPTMLDYHRNTEKLPRRLMFSLAALIAFYRGSELRDGALIGRRGDEEYRIADVPAALAALASAWKLNDPAKVAAAVLADRSLWGEDLSRLPGAVEMVAGDLTRIQRDGAAAAVAKIEGE